jgi:hypothetical protein
MPKRELISLGIIRPSKFLEGSFGHRYVEDFPFEILKTGDHQYSVTEYLTNETIVASKIGEAEKFAEKIACEIDHVMVAEQLEDVLAARQKFEFIQKLREIAKLELKKKVREAWDEKVISYD